MTGFPLFSLKLIVLLTSTDDFEYQSAFAALDELRLGSLKTFFKEQCLQVTENTFTTCVFAICLALTLVLIVFSCDFYSIASHLTGHNPGKEWGGGPGWNLWISFVIYPWPRNFCN